MEEVLQRLALIAHLAHRDTQHYAEADQSQDVAAALVVALDLVRLQVTWNRERFALERTFHYKEKTRPFASTYTYLHEMIYTVSNCSVVIHHH